MSKKNYYEKKSIPLKGMVSVLTSNMRRIMKHYILQSIVIIIDVILSIFLNIVVKLAVYGKYFEDAIQSRLSSTHSRVVVPFSTDVYRYLFGSKTELLASKEDFTKLSLSHIWYFKLNCH